jgi:hypothetical protein
MNVPSAGWRSAGASTGSPPGSAPRRYREIANATM